MIDDFGNNILENWDKKNNRFVEYFLIVISILLLIVSGCDNTKCRPDGGLENKKGDFYIGFRCGGNF